MESSQTPKPPTISLWRNVLYAWKKLKAVEGPAYFLILGLSLICQVAAPLIGLILPSTIVRLYQANTPWQQMVWSIFLMSFALLLLQLGKPLLQPVRLRPVFLFNHHLLQIDLFQHCNALLFC